MDALDLATAIGAVASTDDPRGLTQLAAQLRQRHPGDPEADTVARQAELKRHRLIQAS